LELASLDRIRVVLVNTTHPGNIGAAARAMKNMGLTRLYLVEPRDFPSDKARWRSANASDVVAQAVVVETLNEAIADCGLVIGTSARDRRIPWPLINPEECGRQVIRESTHHEVAILFGREARGLKNEELQKCQYHVHIPTSTEYTSLNLAMAVQVISYEVRRAYLDHEHAGQDAAPVPLDNSQGAGFSLGVDPQNWDQEFSTNEDMELFFTHLERALIKIDFHDPDNPRQLMSRLRRLYQRIRPDKMEMNILRGILTSIEAKSIE
jgi:tRNA (cytidine32/uridine32-2'-O)-methyltransferase